MKATFTVDFNSNEGTNISYADFVVGAAPATPSASRLRAYAKTGNLLAYRRDDGVEVTLPGGPSSSADNAIVRFNGTTGEIQGSGVSISDLGVMDFPVDGALKTSGQTIVDLGLAQLIDGENDLAVDWNLVRKLYSKTGPSLSVDWEARQLVGADGSTVLLDWSGSHPAFNGKRLTSIGAPSSTDDAATKQYVDNLVAGLLDFKGSQDCSANPNYPAASKGDSYYVSVAGKIGGASGKSVDVGDLVVASADNAGGTEASVGASWFVLEHSLSGVALTSGKLSQFAATTSAELAGVISDETGTGALVFANSPTFVTPALGTPVSGNLGNCTLGTESLNPGIYVTTGTFAKTSTTTMAAITELTATLVTGGVYEFDGFLNCSCGATGGVSVSMIGTVTPASIAYSVEISESSAALSYTAGAYTALTNGTTNATKANGYTAFYALFRGVIRVTTGGTFAPAFAQHTSNGTASNVLVNGFFRLRRIG